MQAWVARSSKGTLWKAGVKVTHWPLGNVEVILQVCFSNSFYKLIFYALPIFAQDCWILVNIDAANS